VSAVLDATPFLRPEREELLACLQRLTDEEWDAPTECPAWSVKGIALHILGDDLSLVARQRDEAPSGVLRYAEEHPGLTFARLLDGFNEQWVAAAGFLSPALIGDLLDLSGQLSEDLYRSVDPMDLGEPVGFFGSRGQPSPWWQVIAREYVERWIHHSQIRRAVGCPPVPARLTAPAVHAVVLGFGARIPGLGSFTIDDRTWDFGAGEAVAVDPDFAALALSRGLTLDETIDVLDGEPTVVEEIAAQTCLDLYDELPDQ
jgi:uncharacterized protein (TIGR03083 family)